MAPATVRKLGRTRGMGTGEGPVTRPPPGSADVWEQWEGEPGPHLRLPSAACEAEEGWRGPGPREQPVPAGFLRLPGLVEAEQAVGALMSAASRACQGVKVGLGAPLSLDFWGL